MLLTCGHSIIHSAVYLVSVDNSIWFPGWRPLYQYTGVCAVSVGEGGEFGGAEALRYGLQGASGRGVTRRTATVSTRLYPTTRNTRSLQLGQIIQASMIQSGKNLSFFVMQKGQDQNNRSFEQRHHPS